MTAIKEAFFKPGKLSSQDKASMTDKAAKQIITAESDQRVKKTERLRQLREAQEAAIAAPPPTRTKKPSGKK
ncbi:MULTISPECIES: hypothetical protein [unclassified Rhizobium]|uniref:hypothetical protein n=1 Tax=unclassified Rhizobium TaxID=2613769 RepID=UPI002478F062|nr:MULTISPECIES: hypothetical protein [unclassified Rhizobium]MDH7804376.1 hypothetical protein [Rhizobium sp. AN70]